MRYNTIGLDYILLKKKFGPKLFPNSIKKNSNEKRYFKIINNIYNINNFVFITLLLLSILLIILKYRHFNLNFF